MKKLLFVLPIVVLLVAGCGKTATTQGNNSQNGAPDQQQVKVPVKTIDVPMPTKAYVSAKDGFTANFPGIPNVKKSSLPSSSLGPIPVTEYRQVFTQDKEQAYYNIGVYHYPADYEFPDNYLNTIFKTFYTVVTLEFPDAKIASQQPAQFLGNPAVAGEIIGPDKLADGSTVNKSGYLLITVKNQNTYIISAYGMDQANFKAFTDSFKFAQ